MTPPPSSPHLSQLAFQLSLEGRHEQALDLLKRGTQSEPANPYLAVNLGFCALAAEQSAEAVAAFDRAEALLSSQQLDVVNVLERLVHGWLLAQRADRAALLLQRHAPLEVSSPEPVTVLHASVAAASGDADQALTLFGQFQDPSSREALSAPLSSLLLDQGRLLEAEQVLVQSPGTATRADLVTNLAILATELGRVPRARSLYRQALELEPQSFVPAYNLARFYFLEGDAERAQDAARHALSLAPQAREGYQLLEQIASGRSDFQAALAVIEQWRRLHPTDLSAQVAACRVYAALQDHQALSAMLPDLVSRCPGHPELLALLAGLPRSVRASQGLGESLMACFEPSLQVVHRASVVSEGLCHDLEAMILRDPTLHGHRPNKPSRQGSQTHELFSNPLSPLMLTLVEVLSPHVEVVLAGVSPDQRQALAFPSSIEGLTFSGWGVVLDTGGYQAPHVHPESLISGVLYLRLPEPASGQSLTTSSPGSICFYGDGVHAAGSSESEAAASVFATGSILPSMGDLVLFPSYLWHGTMPFSAPGPRICLAFNVVPDRG
jgi:Flp pilus assembly protein TadD